MKIILALALIFYFPPVWSLTDLEKQMAELQKQQLEAIENDGVPKKDTKDKPKEAPKDKAADKSKKSDSKDSSDAKADVITEEEACRAIQEGKIIQKYLDDFVSKEDKFFLTSLKARHQFLVENFTEKLGTYLEDNLSKLDLVNLAKNNGKNKSNNSGVLNTKVSMLVEKYNNKLEQNKAMAGFCQNCRVSDINTGEDSGVIQICDGMAFDNEDKSVNNQEGASHDFDLCIEYNFIDKKIVKGKKFKDAYSYLFSSDSLEELNMKGHPLYPEYEFDISQKDFVNKELDKKCSKKTVSKTAPIKVDESKREAESPEVPSTPKKKEEDKTGDKAE